ncbi:TonB-dependent receptor [Catenovulum sp. 2E275]|uniref:TonB-dependent receptor n=1 Tax=Catenovulum sp. 2E275 TaxID=2980497 RepID=UPI0021CE26E6|nr:TonB-dependent receptor [Catenovulum sp. 2E275]MCU4674026.1 TonB-dependent receptor [Catenovulum sp. 2E275]
MKYKLSKIAMSLLSITAISMTANAAEEQENIETIVVKGIAGSLAESARQKRFNVSISDAVVAEDIGKLPDNNIAEALQRITGVSIKSDFGVGESVTIRGVSENLILLNGRSTAGPGRGGISLDDFPSSFLKKVEVIKSPTPEMIEGALGGTVNMETVRPLELMEPLIALSIDGEYADKTENIAPKLSAAMGRNWNLGELGTFGASINFAYQDRELRRDEFFNKFSMVDDIDLDGDGTIDTSGGPNGKFQLRTESTSEQKTEQRERTAYGISLQWAPANVDANIYLDFNNSELDGGQQAYSILDVGGSVVPMTSSYYDGNGMLQNYQLDGVFTIPKTWSDFTTSESSSNAIGGEWYVTNNLKLSGEYSTSESQELQTASEFNLRPIKRDDYLADNSLNNNTSTATITQSGGIPSIVYADPILLDEDNMVFRELFHKTLSSDNQETAFRFDVEYSDFGLDFVTKIKAGVRTTDREFSADRYDLKFDGSTTLKDAYKNAKVDGIASPVWVDNEVISGSFVTLNPDNVFEQNGLSGQNDLLTYHVYNADILSNDIEKTFSQVKQILEGTSYAITGSLADNMHEDNSAYKLIEEKTNAFYTQFHLEYEDISAVVGGRYVETELDSSIVVSVDANGKKTLETRSNEYSDFLPSLNVTYTLSQETLLRFAAAKVMRRADFDNLSPSLVINNDRTSGSSGSYDLEPYRVTQYDFSLEHYFGQGGLASAAIFYKDVASFTENRTTCVADSSTVTNQNTTQWDTVCILDEAGVSKSEIVTKPITTANGQSVVDNLRVAGLTGIQIAKDVNGGSGEVTGLELAYQQQLDFLPGLGVNVNYTYADSSQPDGNPLLNISNHTFNGQIYYENQGFQARLAYNWRDSYLYSQIEKRVETVGALGLGIKNSGDPEADGYDPTVGNNYQNERGQFDFSVSYDIDDNFTVLANVVNLTGEPTTYSNELGSTWKYSESDRRFTVGMRAKF